MAEEAGDVAPLLSADKVAGRAPRSTVRVQRLTTFRGGGAQTFGAQHPAPARTANQDAPTLLQHISRAQEENRAREQAASQREAAGADTEPPRRASLPHGEGQPGERDRDGKEGAALPAAPPLQDSAADKKEQEQWRALRSKHKVKGVRVSARGNKAGGGNLSPRGSMELIEEDDQQDSLPTPSPPRKAGRRGSTTGRGSVIGGLGGQRGSLAQAGGLGSILDGEAGVAGAKPPPKSARQSVMARRQSTLAPGSKRQSLFKGKPKKEEESQPEDPRTVDPAKYAGGVRAILDEMDTPEPNEDPNKEEVDSDEEEENHQARMTKEAMEMWMAEMQKAYISWRITLSRTRQKSTFRQIIKKVCTILAIAHKFRSLGESRDNKRREAMKRPPEERTAEDRALAQESMTRIHYFQDLSTSQLSALSATIRCREYSKSGAVVYTEEDIADAFFVIASGSVQIKKTESASVRNMFRSTSHSDQDPAGATAGISATLIIAEKIKGESFGEEPLNHGAGTMYGETAITREHTELLIVDRESYISVVKGMRDAHIKDLMNNLRRMPIFRRLSDPTAGVRGENALHSIAVACVERTVPKNSVVVHQGEESDTSFFFAIKSGAVRVVRMIAMEEGSPEEAESELRCPYPRFALRPSRLTPAPPSYGRRHKPASKPPTEGARKRALALNFEPTPDELDSMASLASVDPVHLAGAQRGQGYKAMDSKRWCHANNVKRVPLEIDELTQGAFFVRNYSGRSHGTQSIASLVTLCDCNLYVLNKWDFVRVMSQFNTSDVNTLDEVNEQVRTYTDNSGLLVEWSEGENWENYKRNLVADIVFDRKLATGALQASREPVGVQPDQVHEGSPLPGASFAITMRTQDGSYGNFLQSQAEQEALEKDLASSQQEARPSAQISASPSTQSAGLTLDLQRLESACGSHHSTPRQRQPRGPVLVHGYQKKFRGAPIGPPLHAGLEAGHGGQGGSAAAGGGPPLPLSVAERRQLRYFGNVGPPGGARTERAALRGPTEDASQVPGGMLTERPDLALPSVERWEHMRPGEGRKAVRTKTNQHQAVYDIAWQTEDDGGYSSDSGVVRGGRVKSGRHGHNAKRGGLVLPKIDQLGEQSQSGHGLHPMIGGLDKNVGNKTELEMKMRNLHVTLRQIPSANAMIL